MGGTSGDADGELELALTGIHPYLAWSLTRNVDVWGTAGRAWGDFGISEDVAGERMSSEATLDPGAAGRGPSVSLARSWGGTTQDAPRPRDFGMTEPFRRNALAERLDAELAYGFAVPGSSVLLTPFGAASLYGTNEQVFRLGGRLRSAGTAIVRLELERRERSERGRVHAIYLFVSARFQPVSAPETLKSDQIGTDGYRSERVPGIGRLPPVW